MDEVGDGIGGEKLDRGDVTLAEPMFMPGEPKCTGDIEAWE
jgi:hypothetical protein